MCTLSSSSLSVRVDGVWCCHYSGPIVTCIKSLGVDVYGLVDAQRTSVAQRKVDGPVQSTGEILIIYCLLLSQIHHHLSHTLSPFAPRCVRSRRRLSAYELTTSVVDSQNRLLTCFKLFIKTYHGPQPHSGWTYRHTHHTLRSPPPVI